MRDSPPPHSRRRLMALIRQPRNSTTPNRRMRFFVKACRVLPRQDGPTDLAAQTLPFGRRALSGIQLVARPDRRIRERARVLGKRGRALVQGARQEDGAGRETGHTEPAGAAPFHASIAGCRAPLAPIKPACSAGCAASRRGSAPSPTSGIATWSTSVWRTRGTRQAGFRLSRHRRVSDWNRAPSCPGPAAPACRRPQPSPCPARACAPAGGRVWP